MNRILPVLLCVGCGGDPAIAPDVIPTDGQRVNLPQVTFNRWTDILALQGALDDDCRFMSPLIADDSTSYPPLQVFWVIYDNVNDVKDGDVVTDTFFEGDVVRASDFEMIDGLDALGFKFLPPSQRMFLSITDMAIEEEGARLEATLGAPLSATLFVEAAGEPGACTTTTTFCLLEDETCEPASLSSIDLELSGLLAVKDITWNP